MSIPDYISPIVGYRVWTWDTKGLKSLCGERWHPSQSLAARCRASAVVGPIVGRAEAVHDAHEPPQTNCTCGVYATRTIEHLRLTDRSIVIHDQDVLCDCGSHGRSTVETEAQFRNVTVMRRRT